jgi:hypothetical protein
MAEEIPETLASEITGFIDDPAPAA